MVSEEKKQRFSELLKYIRSNDGVKQFAARLEIKLPTYSGWETARAFPRDEIWKNLLPKLCQLSGFTPDLIDQYLRGDYELSDLVESQNQADLLPRAKPIITRAKFRAWLQTLSLSESIQVLQDAAEHAAQLASQQPQQPHPQVSPFPLQDAAKFPQLPEILAEFQPVLTGQNSAENPQFKSAEIIPQKSSNEAALVNLILPFIESLSLENQVQIDNRLRELIFLHLQELGLLQMRKYQNHPFYLLMEGYRITNHLTYEQFEERLLAEGEEAGLDPQRVSQIVRGEVLPDDQELIWIGVFVRQPDGRLYDHDELVALRDGTVKKASNSFITDHDSEDPPRNFADHQSVKSGNGQSKLE